MTAPGAPGAVVDCAGIPITACTREAAAAYVVALARADRTGSGVDVHLCNAYTLALADADASFKEVLGAASVNFPDGKSVVWANRLRHGRHLPSDRVYGPDLFLDTFAAGERSGLRHYLLGSTEEVLHDLERELLRRFPEATIVGRASPPFRAQTEQERAEQDREIRDSGAHVVWLGLGTPKQDWEAARLSERHPCVFVAVGAAFDFVAGRKRQAPGWVQRAGLEWLFRLATEPRRLWRRYLFGNVRFVRAALRARR